MHGFHSHLQDEGELAKDIAIYYGMISLMDKYIGAIVDKLDALGLAEDTLVVFTSDHGHFFGQHGLIAKGAFHYEDLIRVPMIVRQPGAVPAGVESDALQSLVDYAPTFLGATGQNRSVHDVGRGPVGGLAGRSGGGAGSCAGGEPPSADDCVREHVCG